MADKKLSQIAADSPATVAAGAALWGSAKVTAAKAGISAPAAIANATIQKVLLDTETFDVGPFFDPTTNRFTPPAGLYQFEASVAFTPALGSGFRMIVYVYKNGAQYKAYTESSHNSATNICETNGFVDANGTDYFEMYARHDSGLGTISIQVNSTAMTMVRIGSMS